MRKGAKYDARAVWKWAASTFQRPATFLTCIEGLDPLRDLTAQLRELSTPRDVATALATSQERTVKSSQYVRKILDALSDRRLEEAASLVRAQVWPSINVVSAERELEIAIGNAMLIGNIETDVAVANLKSGLAEVRLILQRRTASAAVKAYDRLRREPFFSVQHV